MASTSTPGPTTGATSAAASALPSNVHISTHPLLQAKLSQFRSAHATARESKALVHDIATILGCEALGAELAVVPDGGEDTSPLGYRYPTLTIGPERVSLIPILRSGLGMVDAISALLPHAVPIHHLGLYREPATLQPVEYYNNLADHVPAISTTSTSQHAATSPPADRLAIVLDPIIATGGTAAAAVQMLREWGAVRVVVLSVLGSEEGVRRVAAEADEEGWVESGKGSVSGSGRASDQEGGGGEGQRRRGKKVEIYVGAVDQKLDQRGMIVPGVGDVGDRLFGTKGK